MGMRARVTCEICGNVEHVERLFFAPEVFNVICVKCESVLQVDVRQEDLLLAAMKVAC